jgi:hypothetical protein
MSKIFIVGAAAVTTAVVLGGVACYGLYRRRITRRLCDNLNIVSAVEADLAEDQRKNHVPCDEGVTPDPEELLLNTELSDAGGICVTLRLNGAVVTICHGRPGWRDHRALLATELTARFYAELQATAHGGPVPIDRQLRCDIAHLLTILFGQI